MIMEKNKQLVKLLTSAINDLTLAMPLLEEMNGQIPSEILDLLDFANKITVKY